MDEHRSPRNGCQCEGVKLPAVSGRGGDADPLPECQRHIALFVKSMAGGGAERTFLNLARVFSKRGHRVDILLTLKRGPLLSDVPEAVKLIELGAPPLIHTVPLLFRLSGRRGAGLQTLFMGKLPKAVRSLPGLLHYLRRERPEVLLANPSLSP